MRKGGIAARAARTAFVAQDTLDHTAAAGFLDHGRARGRRKAEDIPRLGVQKACLVGVGETEALFDDDTLGADTGGMEKGLLLTLATGGGGLGSRSGNWAGGDRHPHRCI